MKKKVLLFIFILVLVYAAGGFIYLKLNKEEPEVIVVEDVDKIKGYDYTLKSNSSDLYKEEFKVLKDNLEKDKDDEQYALSVAKLFIIDLYSLSNKINKYDVGGVEFVYPDHISNYKLNVQNTIYKYMEDNSTGKRNQKLPLVSSIEVKSHEKTTFKIGNKSFDGYKVELEWEYNEDLDYESKGEVIVIKEDDKYLVVEKN